MTTLRRRSRDDSGSLALAMLVMVAGLGLTGVMLTTLLQNVQSTRTEAARTAALQGARAGIASALASIRSAGTTDATTGVTRGVTANLPCTGITGSGANGSTKDYTVAVTVTYFTQDPTGHTAAWLLANGKACATDVAGGVPSFAYLESVGTDSLTQAKRTLFGVYAFRRIANANLPGGQIHVWRNASDVNNLCLDAGSSPGAGTVLAMQTCATNPDGTVVDAQKFGYEPNLTIVLTTADTTVYPNGLCVDAGTPQQAKNTLTLQPCGTSTKIEQEWSFNFASGFFGTSDGVAVNDFCWSVTSRDTPGSTVTLNDTSGTNGNSACNTNFPNNFQSWNPSPAVGAGAAGGDNSQLVNFEEFGRCLDVTYEDVTKPYEVVFQCKQSPTPDLVNNWNQSWHVPAGGVGAIYTHNEADNKNYCLTMPSLATTPLLVVVQECLPGYPAANQTWWVRGAATEAFDEAYRIEGLGGYAGYCLASLTDQPAWQQANKAGLQPCSGASIQKWNVVPSLNPSGMSSIGER